MPLKIAIDLDCTVLNTTERLVVCHEKIECKHEDTTFYDDIAKTNTFIIEDKSPQYRGYECCMFKGVVIKESNGSYHWWKSIDQRGMISNE